MTDTNKNREKKVGIFINLEEKFEGFPEYYKKVDIDEACNLSLDDIEDKKKLFLKSGFYSISKYIIDFLKENGIIDQLDSFFVDHAPYASVAKYDKIIDFIIFIEKSNAEPNDDLREKIVESYLKVYSFLSEKKFRIYFHKDFFSSPPKMQALITSSGEALEIIKENEMKGESFLEFYAEYEKDKKISSEEEDELRKKDDLHKAMIEINENDLNFLDDKKFKGVIGRVEFPKIPQPGGSNNKDGEHDNEDSLIHHSLFHYPFHRGLYENNLESYLLSIPLIISPFRKEGLSNTSGEDNVLGAAGAIFVLIAFKKSNKRPDLNVKNILRQLSKDLSYISKDLFSGFLYDSAIYQKNEALKHACKVAVAAIMSRNVSHNIGSHVLSTLGFEGISAADDRILFRYLHQRMDYIAQISTEMPKWTQSSWFLNDLMKRFYMQENLLKYLGHSEGLTAYYYKKTVNKDAIEIKVKKKTSEKWGESEDIIPGSSPNDKAGKLKDFQLAIPGGVVGCHAFYTILENFIRNAAKHDWGKADNKGIENLEITIEFENSPDKDHIFFAVYYNIPLEPEREKKIVEDTLNASFKNSFIDDKGELIRKNWGLGEMRVSAGYLLKKDYSDIGFGRDDVLFEEKGNSFSGIIKAEAIEINGKKYLGYRFAVPKPKELLFIGKWSDLKEKGEEDAKRCGIWFHKHIPPERDYNFIIFEGNIFEEGCSPWKRDGKPDDLLIIKFLDQFPARIFVVWDDNSNSELKKTIEGTTEENQNPILKRRIISLKKEAFNNLTKFDQDQGNTYFEKLKISIYKRWIDHLAYLKDIKNLKIHVYLGGDGTDTSNEKEKRIFKYLLDNQLERVLIESKNNSIKHAGIGYDELKIKLSQIVENLLNNRNSLENKEKLYDVFKSELIKRIDEIKESYQDEIKEIENYKKYFVDYLNFVFDSIFEITKDLIYKDEEKIDTLPTVLREQKYSKPDIKDIAKEINKFPSDLDLKKELNIEDSSNEDDGDIIYKRHTPKYLDSDEKQYCEALSGSQSFFGILCSYLNESIKGQEILLQLIENALLQITIIDERIRDFYLNRFKNSVDKFKSAKISIPRGIIIYTGYDKDKIGFSLQSEYIEIVEKAESNGKKKVKIKDKLKEKFQANGIYIVEDKLSSGVGENELGLIKIDEKKPLKIDILIIHQGIIDKMDFDNEKEREEFLDSIKKCIPFVIITSGRGDPMVPETKFIPFSSIESYLMTDYPEKNLLIQSLMQIFKEKEKK